MNRIDELDIVIIDSVRCCQGHPLPFGASLVGNGGINFSVNSADAAGCALQLYHRGEAGAFADIRIPDSFRVGSNYSIIVFDQNPEELEYTYRFWGEMDPARGLLFDPEIPLLDPYARLISGREVWGQKKEERIPMRCRVVPEDFAWEGDRALEIPLEDLVIYEMHVRGLTMDPSSPAKRKGTFAGVIEMIPYFKELGINCVELLPVFEFDELENHRIWEGKSLCNFWGYSTVGFFAPKSAYAFSGIYGMTADEMKNMVKQLHRNGIEVILDVVFNHTAEMGEGGPTLHFRGIDNRTYYHLGPEGEYLNYSGCGNTVNCNNVIVRQYILDCLRYWVSDFHVDGFRFDEAPILSRGVSGEPMQSPPLLESLAHDPILSRSKLIAEAWDAAGLYQVGSFPAPDKWADWNGRFRDCVRHFIKGDADAGPELIRRIQGSPDVYSGRKEHSTINFVTCHDGFTLNDLVSYNAKHNLANGEYNRDGADHNISWNCGVEGPSEDPEIEELRSRQVKNAFALLMLSRGTPMMYSGDEFRNSQEGNNNAYCQDSPLSWVSWENLERYPDVHEFFRDLIRFRKDHPVLRKRQYYSGYNSTGYPEISFHGENAWNLNMWEPFLTFGFMYAEGAEEFSLPEDRYIYCGVNAHWESHALELPILPAGLEWRVYASSDRMEKKGSKAADRKLVLEPRSLTVLVSEKEK